MKRERTKSMNLSSFVIPFFIFVIGVCILFATIKWKLQYSIRKQKKNWKTFLEEEHNACFTSSVPIPDTLLIKCDKEDLPVPKSKDLLPFYTTLCEKVSLPKVLLKDKTNRFLKQTYGINTFEQLIIYEQNYYDFMDLLLKYGDILIENNYIEDAKIIFELAIKLKCDYSKCYIQLAKLYQQEKNQSALLSLRQQVIHTIEHNTSLQKILHVIDSK